MIRKQQKHWKFYDKKTAKTLEISLQTETLKNTKHVKVGTRE